MSGLSYKYIRQIVSLDSGLLPPGSPGTGEEIQLAETYTAVMKRVRKEEETPTDREYQEALTTGSSECPFMVMSNISYQKYAAHQVQGRGSQYVWRPGRDF